jgi:hypothetical protein
MVGWPRLVDSNLRPWFGQDSSALGTSSRTIYK